MEEEYQQEQPENNTEYISEQIDVDKELQRFTMEVLRGKVKIVNQKTNKEEWVDIYPGKKMMNELGVRGFLSLLKGVVTKLSKLSNKTDEEIMKDMFYFDMRLTTTMYAHGDEWEIDLADFESLKEACVRLAWDVSASSRDGFTAKNLRSQYSRVDSTRSENSIPQKKKSLFGVNLLKN